MKISLEELDKIRESTKLKMKKVRIMVCSGTGCTSSKSEIILEELKKEIEQKQEKQQQTLSNIAKVRELREKGLL